MSSRQYPSVPLLAACTAIWREDKILLARRDTPPNASKWAMPGGLVEVGETLEQGAMREVWEETQLQLDKVVLNRPHEIIMRDGTGRVERHYVLAMFVAVSTSGLAIAGDDAAAVEWFTLEELDRLVLTENTTQLVHESVPYRDELLGALT